MRVAKSNISNRMIQRYRRRRTSQVLRYNPWNSNAEAGDLMVDNNGKLMRLEESSGWGKRNAGDLTLRTIKPPSPDMVAEIYNGEVWWCMLNNRKHTKT